MEVLKIPLEKNGTIKQYVSVGEISVSISVANSKHVINNTNWSHVPIESHLLSLLSAAAALSLAQN